MIDSPEVRSVIGQVPHLSEFLSALYECKYKDFFRVGGAGAPAAAAAAAAWFLEVHPLAWVVGNHDRGLELTMKARLGLCVVGHQSDADAGYCLPFCPAHNSPGVLC